MKLEPIRLGGRMTAWRLRRIIRGLNGRYGVEIVYVGSFAKDLWSVVPPNYWIDAGVKWAFRPNYLCVVVHIVGGSVIFIRPKAGYLDEHALTQKWECA